MLLHPFKNFNLYTDHPVALDSRDHIKPEGVKNDNTRNPKFVDKITKWFWMQGRINFLDLGCAGGGLVSDMSKAGHFSIGLEGSNYNLLTKRVEWAVTPDLFTTCDVTRPFQLQTKTGIDLKFHVISMWELWEHLPEDRLPQVFDNLKKHLNVGGFLVCSISEQPQYHHVTLHPQSWWEEKFRENGFTLRQDVLDYLSPDFVRGPNQELGTGSEHTEYSFHLAASLT